MQPELLMMDNILDILPSGMIFMQADGSILKINAKARDTLGLSPSVQASDLNRTMPDYLLPLIKLMEQATQDIQRAEISLTLPARPEMSTLGFSLKFMRPDDSQAPLKILTFSDITQVQKDQLAMEKIKDELNQSKKLASIGTLIAGVAHEMNNPLTGISMSASLLKMNLERLKAVPEAQESPKVADSIEKGLLEIQKITRASEKAAVLVNDLLAYSKPSQLVLVALPLQAVVSDIVNALKSHPHFSQFDIKMQGQTPHRVRCDRIRLEQVFYNLVKNACDATDGKGQVTIFFSESQNPKDGSLQVTTHVKDNGPGIDKSVMSQIFDPFFTTKGHSGVGLGLSISYRTIEQHGGLLSVDSIKWQGTEFKITLPVCEEPLYLE
ncbi:two-component system sensor histidine kinase NtrB [Vampirovibrio chlorellavorus]|uniref:two-component system sensor histidine kinase NtrB n=1 Tax=Vampirovibrio chlorellavorus TaxID=758823 RepID=UPI0026ED672E|nr:ATP-binding protein [Vampirovibrio chlorellavorus]